MTSSAHLQREASAARVGLATALDDLKESVTTTAITNGAMTFAKDGSSALAKAAIDRAMASPLAAMLIGAGIVMLMSGGNKDSKVGEVVTKGNDAVRSTGHALAGAGSAIVGAATSALSAASRAGHAVSDTASAAADKVKSTASGLSSTATDAYGKATATATDAYGKATGAATDAYGKAQDLLAQGREQGAETYDQALQLVEQTQGRLEQFAREQPILVAALGVAFGAAIGASLPMTKAEQEYMGDAARKAGAIGADIAQQVADQVTDKMSGGDVKAKVGEVVDTIASTVKAGVAKV